MKPIYSVKRLDSVFPNTKALEKAVVETVQVSGRWGRDGEGLPGEHRPF